MSMKDIRKQTQAIMQERKERKIFAFMGDLFNSIVNVPNRPTYVYVTVAFNGQVLIVKNNKCPTRLRYPIWLGYPQGSKRIQVIGSAEVYNNDPLPEIARHNHTWGESDNPSWIRQEQFVHGGIPYASGGMVVTLGGFVYRLGSQFHVVDTTNFDMTAYIPTSGARWVNVEIDDAKAITYNEGSEVISRAALTYEDIPVTAIGKKLLFSVRTYVGQSVIIQTVTDSDIFDPRFSGVASGGESSSIDWDDVENKPAVFPPDTSYTDVLYPRKWLKFTDPTSADGTGLGYSKTDLWVNQTNNTVWVCADDEIYGAEWILIGGGGGGGTRFVVDGRLAVTDNATTAILLDSDTSISEWALYMENLGTSGSTIIDVLLYRNEGVYFDENPVSIFGDYPYDDHPEMPYNDPDHVAYFTPIITDFLAGDVLVLVIEQTADGASDLIFQPVGQVGGGGAFSLTVSDGVTDVSDVGKITFENAEVTDEGGGEVKVTVPKIYDSGWFAISTGQDIEKTHNLGTQSLMISVYLDNNSGGATGQLSHSYSEPGVPYGACVLINNSDNSFHVVMGTAGYVKRDSVGGGSVVSTGIYCRVVAIGL